MLGNILGSYGIAASAIVQPFGSGLINSTWKVEDGDRQFILQKVNDKVFKAPEHIALNISNMAAYLAKVHPGYFFVTPVHTLAGEPLVHVKGTGYFRLFPFVKNSHTNNVAETPGQAFEAATQFGRFTKMLSGFPVESLKTTLPNFHNLAIRYLQFNNACIEGNTLRILEAEAEIKYLHAQDHIVTRYNAITRSPLFKLRVTHHDTKISNVLFDSGDKGICVIDLDTVMPGYFISDVGDMMRTYLSPVSEEEKDLDKIRIRDDYFEAILKGYLSQMSGELSREEVSSFVFSGIFLIYMQAVRFLTDHLNNDVYYGASYEGQNYVRARNQIQLLKCLLEKENLFNKLVFETEAWNAPGKVAEGCTAAS